LGGPILEWVEDGVFMLMRRGYVPVAAGAADITLLSQIWETRRKIKTSCPAAGKSRYFVHQGFPHGQNALRIQRQVFFIKEYYPNIL